MNRKPIGLLVVLLGFATALGAGLATAQNSADTLTLRLDGATAVYVRDDAGEFASFVVGAPQFVNAAFSERWVVDAPTSRLAAAPAPKVMIRLAAGFDGFSDCSEDTLAKEWRAGELVTIQVVGTGDCRGWSQIQGEDGRRHWVSNITLAASQQAATPAPQVMIRLAAGFDGFSDCSEDTLAKEWRAGELVTIQMVGTVDCRDWSQIQGEDGRRYWVSNVTLAANQQEPTAPASTPPLPDGQWACSVNLQGEDIERLVFALDEWDAATRFFEQARLRGWPVAYPDCSR